MEKRFSWGMFLIAISSFSICLTLNLAIPAVSQEISIAIQGKVSDEEGNPIEGAVISFLNLKTGEAIQTKTNEKGKYHQRNLAPGFYNIYCSKKGYTANIKENFNPLGQRGSRISYDVPYGCEEPSGVYADHSGVIKNYRELNKKDFTVNFTLKKSGNNDCQKLFREAVDDFQNRNIDSAIEKLNKYKELVPDNQNAYILLGRGYYVKKLWKESKEAYEKFFSFNPENVSFQDYFITGELCLRLGEAEKADEYFNKTEAAKPNDPQILYFIGTTYYNSGIYDKAAERFKKAVELKPDYPDAINGLASAYFQLEDWDNTVIYFEKYLDFDPNSSLALLALGDAYSNRFAKSKDKGEAERAIEYYQKYIELNPDASNTEKIKEKINELKKGIGKE